MKPGHTGLTRILKATGFSWLGLKAAWRHESAFRQEVVLFVFLFPLALYLGSNGIERAVLAGSLFLVLIVELLNSGLEAIVDRVGSEHHELAGRAKDMGSAAVFISLAAMLTTWALVLLF